MRFSISLFVALAATAVSASAFDSSANVLEARQYGGYGGGYGGYSQCGAVNGNCYDNDCGGDLSPDGVTCTRGQYAGCQCGYNCGPVNGPCSTGGCNGYGGRCTNNFNGCTCNQWQ